MRHGVRIHGGTRGENRAFIGMPEQRAPGLLCRSGLIRPQRRIETLPDQVDLGGVRQCRCALERRQPGTFTEHRRQLAAAQKLFGTELIGGQRLVITERPPEMAGLELELAFQQGLQPGRRNCRNIRTHRCRQ